ncbi:MAG: hypothetical protein ACI8S3_001559 [Alphaproteobacteria bacterium]|jgi:hypothetical protein
MAFKKQHRHVAKVIAAALRRFAIVGLAGGMITLAAVPAAQAQAQSTELSAAPKAQATKISREYLIKAAILYNFAKFAEWPAAAFSNATAPLRICVIGDDPFGPALGSLQGKTVRNRTLTADHIARVEDAVACHILFISISESERLAGILDTVGALPILTVADMGEFTRSGGIVALKKTEDRSRLEINVGAVEKAGLKLSSKLLRLADTVGTQTALVPRVTK